VLHKRLLPESAIRIFAGPGREDRILTGSYRELRQREQQLKATKSESGKTKTGEVYLPDF